MLIKMGGTRTEDIRMEATRTEATRTEATSRVATRKRGITTNKTSRRITRDTMVTTFWTSTVDKEKATGTTSSITKATIASNTTKGIINHHNNSLNNILENRRDRITGLAREGTVVMA
jgi:hypothetical protein